MALPSNFLRCVLSTLLVLSPSITVADVADTASTEWVDTQFGPPFRKALKRFLLQSGSETAKTPRPVPTDLGPKISTLLRDPTAPGLLISAASPFRHVGKYAVLEGAAGLIDGSASLIGATPDTYNNYMVNGKSHFPGQMVFGWIAAPTIFVAPCAYPTNALTIYRRTWTGPPEHGTWTDDRCGKYLKPPFANWVRCQAFRPEPSQREDELVSLQEALESEQEEKFAAFMLGKSDDLVSWITPDLHAWAAEGRCKTDAGVLLSPATEDERRDANGWLPFNEIVLAHQAKDLPQAVRPQALVYSFDHWHMNFELEAGKLKDMFQRQRAAIRSLLENRNVLPEAVFVGSDGKLDMLLVVVGLDSSLGVTKLSTAGAWVDKKVERWQQRRGVDGARSLGELFAEWGEKKDAELEAELKKLFGEEAEEPLFV